MIVKVNASDAERAASYDACLASLFSLGWTEGSAPGQLRIVDWRDGLEAVSALTLAACRDPETVKHHSTIEPEPFAVLQALGAAQIETTLADSVPAGIDVDRVIIGFNWTLVRAGNLCGVARSPSRGTEGARTIRPEGGFAGQDLRRLAQNLKSIDPLRRSLGLAAVNTYWNRIEVPDEVAGYAVPHGGLATIDEPGEDTVIIGGFRAAQRRLPKARIVERDPKPGDVPVGEAHSAFAKAKTLAITAQTLMNGSLAPILTASDMVPRRMLLGPSCPACPYLFDYGIDEVFGAVVLDAEAAEHFVVESGTMIMLDGIATNRSLRSSRRRDRTRL